MKRLLTMFANRLLIKPSLRLLAAPDSRNVFSRLYLRWVKGVVGIGLPFLVKRLSIPFYSGAPLNNLVLFLSMELPTQRRQKQAAHGHSRFEYFSFLKDCLRHPAYQIPAFEHELGEIMEDASLQAIAISKIFSFETLFENSEQEQAYSKFMSLVATRLADYVERECTPDLAARLRFYARFPCVSALDCCRPVAEALRRMERAVWKSAGILVDTPFDFVAPRKGGPLRVAFFRNDFRESGEVRQLLRTLDAMPETWEAYLIGFEDGAEASILEKLEARNVRRIVVDK